MGKGREGGPSTASPPLSSRPMSALASAVACPRASNTGVRGSARRKKAAACPGPWKKQLAASFLTDALTNHIHAFPKPEFTASPPSGPLTRHWRLSDEQDGETTVADLLITSCRHGGFIESLEADRSFGEQLLRAMDAVAIACEGSLGVDEGSSTHSSFLTCHESLNGSDNNGGIAGGDDFGGADALSFVAAAVKLHLLTSLTCLQQLTDLREGATVEDNIVGGTLQRMLHGCRRLCFRELSGCREACQRKSLLPMQVDVSNQAEHLSAVDPKACKHCLDFGELRELVELDDHLRRYPAMLWEPGCSPKGCGWAFDPCAVPAWWIAALANRVRASLDPVGMNAVLERSAKASLVVVPPPGESALDPVTELARVRMAFAAEQERALHAERAMEICKRRYEDMLVLLDNARSDLRTSSEVLGKREEEVSNLKVRAAQAHYKAQAAAEQLVSARSVSAVSTPPREDQPRDQQNLFCRRCRAPMKDGPPDESTRQPSVVDPLRLAAALAPRVDVTVVSEPNAATRRRVKMCNAEVQTGVDATVVSEPIATTRPSVKMCNAEVQTVAVTLARDSVQDASATATATAKLGELDESMQALRTENSKQRQEIESLKRDRDREIAASTALEMKSEKLQGELSDLGSRLAESETTVLSRSGGLPAVDVDSMPGSGLPPVCAGMGTTSLVAPADKVVAAEADPGAVAAEVDHGMVSASSRILAFLGGGLGLPDTKTERRPLDVSCQGPLGRVTDGDVLAGGAAVDDATRVGVVPGSLESRHALDTQTAATFAYVVEDRARDSLSCRRGLAAMSTEISEGPTVAHAANEADGSWLSDAEAPSGWQSEAAALVSEVCELRVQVVLASCAGGSTEGDQRVWHRLYADAAERLWRLQQHAAEVHGQEQRELLRLITVARQGVNHLKALGLDSGHLIFEPPLLMPGGTFPGNKVSAGTALRLRPSSAARSPTQASLPLPPRPGSAHASGACHSGTGAARNVGGDSSGGNGRCLYGGVAGRERSPSSATCAAGSAVGGGAASAPVAALPPQRPASGCGIIERRGGAAASPSPPSSVGATPFALDSPAPSRRGRGANPTPKHCHTGGRRSSSDGALRRHTALDPHVSVLGSLPTQHRQLLPILRPSSATSYRGDGAP